MSFRISEINLYQFKNYFQEQFRFDQRITAICGRNGLGKTNLLDAIYFLCFTRSYFNRVDQTSVLKGHQGFRIEGQFEADGEMFGAVCILREDGKKEFLLNDVPYTRFSKHIGKFPCVIIAPDDVQLIIGRPEDRRKFIDLLISQLSPEYLEALIAYNKILQQRNSFLRSYEKSYMKELSVLDALDIQLSEKGDFIYAQRRNFLLEFLPMARQRYQDISARFEDINVLYESELEQTNMSQLLERNRSKDLVLQRTSAGIHRDDLTMTLKGEPFRNIASQGQRKSLLFALKLSELEVIRRKKNRNPILMLDDVFEKLDESRIDNLLMTVCSDEAQQVFITDTNCQRVRTKLSGITEDFKVIEL